MRKFILFATVLFFTAIIFTVSCRHKPNVTPVVVTADSSNFPDSISKILVSKCDVDGCHNKASSINAGQLALDSWEHLFNGGLGGAVAIAYSPDYSLLLQRVNMDPALGTAIFDYDSMHNKLLTTAQYLTLSNWIKNGAPDKNGNIPFAADPDTRQKIYLAHSSPCNVVAVIDAKSKLIMRYIKVGDQLDELPHDVEVSSDGAFAYVSLFGGNLVQKIDTRTDAIVSTINLSTETQGAAAGGWSIIYLSPQDTAFMVSGYVPNGGIVSVNTAAMQVDNKKTIDFRNTGSSSFFSYPHGIASNPTFDTFFTTLQYGNAVIRYSCNPLKFKFISVNGQTPGSTDSTDHTSPNPHQVIMAPDYSRYFVTCQHTQNLPGTVSVIDAHTDAIDTQITVGSYPQEMAISTSKNYLFVACMEDYDNPNAGMLGSVYVINLSTYEIVKKIYGNFRQPHDIAVDERDGLLFIGSRNADAGGVVSHHSTSCGGNAGWYSVYDLNTLMPADNQYYQAGRDAYTLAVRFK